MRDITTKPKETMEFTLNGGDTVYSLPLSSSLPMAKVLEMAEVTARADEIETVNYYMDFLREYMGEVVDELTPADVNAVIEAWNVESGNVGADAGE